MKRWLYIGIAIYLFLSTTTAAALGVKQVGTASSITLIGIFLIKLLDRNGRNFINKGLDEDFNILKACIGIIIIRFLAGDNSGITQILFFMTVPIAVAMLVGIQPVDVKANIRKIVLFFFFAECALAIYERAFMVNIFPYIEENDVFELDLEDWMFRSTAFLGHPLVNALVVSTILGFILASGYSLKFKMISFGLGFIALLCFNARGAILAWLLIGSIYVVSIIKENKKNRLLVLAVIAAVVCGILYLVLGTDLGGRITHQDKVIDGSAQSRFDVWIAFDYISTSDLLWGNPSNYGRIMKILNAGGVENSYIVLIINFGLVMFTLLGISLFLFIKKHIRKYTFLQKAILIMSFILVGSFNNSLAGAPAWIAFFLCAKTFYSESESRFINRIIPNTKLVAI